MTQNDPAAYRPLPSLFGGGQGGPALRPLGVSNPAPTRTPLPPPPPPFSPLDLGRRLRLYLNPLTASTLLDAPAGAPAADGGLVGQETDLSTTGRDAIQASPGAKPTRNDAGVNGQRGVTYDGTDLLVVPTLGALTQLELWMVVSCRAGFVTIIAEDYAGSPADDFTIYVDGVSWAATAFGLSGASVFRPLTANVPALVRLIVDADALTGAVILEVDGVRATSGANPSPGLPLTANPLNLGSRVGGSLGLVGSMGGVVGVSELLTTPEETDLRAWFRAAWGTP